MAEVESLALALGRRFSADESRHLAMILSFACDRETISYQEIDLPPELKDEMLMLLHEERLLISTTSSSRGGSAWKDKLLTFEPNEKYQMPRAVRHLVEEAEKTGRWDPQFAEEQCLTETGEHRTADLVRFLCALKTHAPDFVVTPRLMEETATALEIRLDLHEAIDALTRSGIISPPMQTSLRLGLAQYEVNRSLCWGKQVPGVPS